MFEQIEKHIDETKQGSSIISKINEASSKKFYIESYGCAMNFNDSEIVASILYEKGYGTTPNAEDANLILINTCSIRDKAEQTVRNRLKHFKGIKKRNREMLVVIMGCMAERLKDQLGQVGVLWFEEDGLGHSGRRCRLKIRVGERGGVGQAGWWGFLDRRSRIGGAADPGSGQEAG